MTAQRALERHCWLGISEGSRKHDFRPRKGCEKASNDLRCGLESFRRVQVVFEGDLGS